MSGATPGPWRVEKRDGWGEPVIVADGWGGKPLAVMNAHPDTYYRQVSFQRDGRTHTAIGSASDEGEARKAEVAAILKANAALIAAAPDLLQAAERVLKWVEPIAGDNRDEAAATEEIESVAELRAAISRARLEHKEAKP